MANQNSVQDGNQNHSLIGASGTAGTAEARRFIVDDNNNLHVANFDSLVPGSYDTITMAYPSGSVETYTYLLASGTVATITVTYTDATKGSLSSVTNT